MQVSVSRNKKTFLRFLLCVGLLGYAFHSLALGPEGCAIACQTNNWPTDAENCPGRGLTPNGFNMCMTFIKCSDSAICSAIAVNDSITLNVPYHTVISDFDGWFTSQYNQSTLNTKAKLPISGALLWNLNSGANNAHQFTSGCSATIEPCATYLKNLQTNLDGISMYGDNKAALADQVSAWVIWIAGLGGAYIDDDGGDG